MDTLLVVLTILSIVVSLAMAFVVWQVFKGTYAFLGVHFEDDPNRPLLFKLDGKVVSVLMACCLIAMIL